MHQPPLWPDDWEAEADARNGTWRRSCEPRHILADYGRSVARPHTPTHRPVHDVIRSL
ncbi:hypothetical protein [Streptomyces sp. NPDC126499]|uniref:hypothetical protein n=1 Tax=Streptomyces sp. NPDC126499 TaxID=3155314 RepID=UPI00331F8C1C